MTLRCPLTADALLAAVDATLTALARRWSRRFALEFDDTLQDIRFVVVRRAADYDPARCAPTTWANRIALAALRDANRDRRVESAVRLNLRLAAAVVALPEGVPDAEANELTERLAAALTALPRQEAEVLRRLFGVGRTAAPSVKQVAREMKWDPKRVARYREKGLASLRRLLKTAAR